MQTWKPGGRTPVSLTEWSRNEFAQKIWPFWSARARPRFSWPRHVAAPKAASCRRTPHKDCHNPNKLKSMKRGCTQPGAGKAFYWRNRRAGRMFSPTWVQLFRPGKDGAKARGQIRRRPPPGKASGPGNRGLVFPPQIVAFGLGNGVPADAADGALQPGQQAPAEGIVGTQPPNRGGGRHRASAAQFHRRADAGGDEPPRGFGADIRQVRQFIGSGFHGWAKCRRKSSRDFR